MESPVTLDLEWTFKNTSRWNDYGRFLFPDPPDRLSGANEETSLGHGERSETTVGQVVLGQQLVLGGRRKDEGLARFIDQIDAAGGEKKGSRT